MKGIFSVYDRKGELYLPLFMETSNGTAIRKMQDIVDDDSHPMSKHATDFDLIKLAEFGEISGSVKTINKEVLINLGKLKQGE